ncbi:MAG TPA: hypothetical protein VI279_12945 [Rhodocyclaceae bacterium]
MMYLHWLILVPISFGFTLLAMALSPILPLFASADGWLPRWLWWFQTPDNSLDGDNGWKTEHWQWRYKLPAPLCRYVGRFGWLLRNPAYGFEWDGPLSAKIDPNATVRYSGDLAVRNRPNGKEGYCYTVVSNPGGPDYWHWYWVKKINAENCWSINLGWKLKTYAENPARIKTEPKAMFCFSPRATSFDP